MPTCIQGGPETCSQFTISAYGKPWTCFWPTLYSLFDKYTLVRAEGWELLVFLVFVASRVRFRFSMWIKSVRNLLSPKSDRRVGPTNDSPNIPVRPAPIDSSQHFIHPIFDRANTHHNVHMYTIESLQRNTRERSILKTNCDECQRRMA